MIEPLDLLLAPDPKAYVRAARPLAGDGEALDALVPGLFREIALRHYRETYPKHVPHGLFALLGALESADLLDGPERTWPVLQALSYSSQERRFDPWPIGATPPKGDEKDLAAGLGEDDFETAYAAARALIAARRIETARDTILAAAARDGFNVCHRFLYAAKVFRRLQRQPDLDAKAMLFPVLHYATTAPHDFRYEAGLAEPATRSHEEIAAVAANHLSGTPHDEYDWVPVAHAVTLAETTHWWRSVSDHPATAAAHRLAEQFLPDAIEEGRASPTDPGPVDEGDPETLLARLAASIDARDEATARAAARGLEARGDLRLGTTLLTSCARIDGSLAFSHDVKVTAATVRLTGVPGPDHVLSDVAAFLARLPVGNGIARALF
jgi:hypothetical protein